MRIPWGNFFILRMKEITPDNYFGMSNHNIVCVYPIISINCLVVSQGKHFLIMALSSLRMWNFEPQVCDLFNQS